MCSLWAYVCMLGAGNECAHAIRAASCVTPVRSRSPLHALHALHAQVMKPRKRTGTPDTRASVCFTPLPVHADAECLRPPSGVHKTFGDELAHK